MRTYTFFSDPAHGWLCVPIEDLLELGIQNQITRYSYRKNKVAYLEEDCDAFLFLKAAEQAGWDITIKESYCNSRFKIRSYDSY